MNYPPHVTLIEVGPRDGLQNEPVFVATQTKIALINLFLQKLFRSWLIVKPSSEALKSLKGFIFRP